MLVAEEYIRKCQSSVEPLLIPDLVDLLGRVESDVRNILELLHLRYVVVRLPCREVHILGALGILRQVYPQFRSPTLGPLIEQHLLIEVPVIYHQRLGCAILRFYHSRGHHPGVLQPLPVFVREVLPDECAEHRWNAKCSCNIGDVGCCSAHVGLLRKNVYGCVKTRELLDRDYLIN
ncbi:hypothetical protein SDC9_143606 [bioreactor metagenome]|uniref:Uncharacterized protein n=1 Tax=bioreactor metagenome TaxID=1076179 RepID=A0A645E6K8_9ZZZZ